MIQEKIHRPKWDVDVFLGAFFFSKKSWVEQLASRQALGIIRVRIVKTTCTKHTNDALERAKRNGHLINSIIIL